LEIGKEFAFLFSPSISFSVAQVGWGEMRGGMGMGVVTVDGSTQSIRKIAGVFEKRRIRCRAKVIT
jgi:hypothetical protein